MTAWHRDREAAEAALEAAFREVELVEEVMSLYRSESQLCRLNRDTVLERPAHGGHGKTRCSRACHRPPNDSSRDTHIGRSEGAHHPDRCHRPTGSSPPS